jgi:peptidoglycan/LPS O-acetylase OafA/YrhL
MSARGDHLPALDGLRALAIVLVLGRHALRPFDDEPLLTVAGYDPFSLLLNGWLGVDLFFALSGYLVGRRILCDYAAARFSWAEYARGRMLRITPAYLAIVGIALVGLIAIGAREPAALATSLASHLLFLQDLTGSDFVVPLWSLGVEAKFYLAAPLLIGLALRGGGKWLIAIALVPLCLRAAMWANLDHALSYDTFFASFRSPFYACWDGLALGVLAAWMLHRPGAGAHQRAARWAFTLGGIGFATLLLAPPWFANIDWFDALFLQIAAASFAALLVFGAAAGAGPQALLGAPPLRWLARHAYALYLTHWLMIAPALALTRGVSADRLTQWLAFTPLYLALAFALAIALHRFIEAPFLRPRWRGGAAAVAASEFQEPGQAGSSTSSGSTPLARISAFKSSPALANAAGSAERATRCAPKPSGPNQG